MTVSEFLVRPKGNSRGFHQGSLKELPILEDASCKHIENPEMFFQNQIKTLKLLPKLRAICDACPVKVECKNYALEHDIREGFWGGLTEDERQVIRLSTPKVDRTLGRPESWKTEGIIKMKQSGASYADIAEHFQVTKEAAIQVMVRHRKKTPAGAIQ